MDGEVTRSSTIRTWRSKNSCTIVFMNASLTYSPLWPIMLKISSDKSPHNRACGSAKQKRPV